MRGGGCSLTEANNPTLQNEFRPVLLSLHRVLIENYLKQIERYVSLQKVNHDLCGEAAMRRGGCQAHGGAESHSWEEQTA